MDIIDGTQMQYKYTRGSWDRVESWGSIVNINNRTLTISYDSDGTQLVDNTAIDWGTGPDDEKAVQYWRDPLVVSYTPTADAVDVQLETTVAVNWSIPMEPDTDFLVEGPDEPVAGVFSYDEVAQSVTLTPDSDLEPGTAYTVTISAAVSVGIPGGDAGVQQAPVVFSFTTITIEAQIENLIAEVEALRDAGILNSGKATGLITKLESVLDKLEKGNLTPALNQLNAFINQVNGFIDEGILTPEEGQALIDAANDLISQISG